MNWLNYHHLLYFKVIAETGSLSKASEVLRVGQSSLSMQLKQLEERLERPLFERKQKRLVLTEAGQIALKYAQDIFSMGDEMLNTLSDGKTKDQVSVQIGIEEGVPHYAATSLLSHALDLEGAAPTVSHNNTETLIEDLLEHRLDMVLTMEQPSPHSKKSILLQKRVANSAIFVVSHKKYLHLKKDFPSSLENIPCLIYSPLSRPRHEIERFYHENKISLNVVLETDENVIMKNLAVQGKGITFLTQGSIDHWVKNKDLIVLGQLPVNLELWLVTLKRKMINPVAQELMDRFSLES